MICTNPATVNPIVGAQVWDPAFASLLGSIGDATSITYVIDDKIYHHATMGERLQHLTMQDTLILLLLLLLRNSFTIPKLLYIIRSSPSSLSPNLQEYDEILRSIYCQWHHKHPSR